MNYKEEIEKLKAQIQELKQREKDEIISKAPDVTGKYFRPAFTERWYITKVLDVYDDGEMNCEAITVYTNEKDAKICVDEIHSLSQYHIDKCETDREDFDRFYERALEIISSYR